MAKLSIEEEFIIKTLEEKGGKLNYRELQTLCQEEFEGVRLILKKLKEKNIVSYDGIIPDYSADIELKK
jgi:transcription initiation factor IIE alpha subunit